MSNIMELAKQAGAVSYTNRHYPDRPYRTFGPEELQKFYTLARADLEAENAKLKEALQMLYDEMMDYGKRNNLGGENNHVFVIARAALEATNGQDS